MFPSLFVGGLRSQNFPQITKQWNTREHGTGIYSWFLRPISLKSMDNQ